MVDLTFSVTDMIIFAQKNCETLIDRIPLVEVSLVRDMHTAGDDDLEESNFVNSLMIETQPDGYNAGRTYYLQAESKVVCQEIINKVQLLRLNVPTRETCLD